MREQDREIIEDAARHSAEGEDFDEMLLRATKKHLPMKYNKHFGLLLEEILKEADEKGITNRQAALELLKRMAAAPPPVPPPEVHPGRTEERPEGRAGALQAGRSPASPSGQSPPERQVMPAPAGRAGEPEPPGTVDKDAQEEEEGAGGETSAPVEKLPETQKILDLGGTSPESLPPEVQDKLKKLVKVQKKKPAWEEGGPEEEPEPGLFFKGIQRAPPVVPPKKPEQKPAAAGDGRTAGEPGEESAEDLETEDG